MPQLIRLGYDKETKKNLSDLLSDDEMRKLERYEGAFLMIGKCLVRIPQIASLHYKDIKINIAPGGEVTRILNPASDTYPLPHIHLDGEKIARIRINNLSGRLYDY